MIRPLGSPPTTQGKIHGQCPGWDHIDFGLRGAITQTHDATLTEGFGDGLNRRIKVAFLFL